ncbi:MAG TPA: cysteine dioxygenase [Burkholderiaceae bacterium]|nr:cysteine dioxygenase [Burkholderiaceae bacterium]
MGTERFSRFIEQMTAAADRFGGDEAKMLDAAEPLLRDLIRNDDWLPDAFSQPSNDAYRQYLLYCDPKKRFSVVSFVWQPGQKTPVHDHTVWGLVGVMRGAELCEEFQGVRKVGEHRLAAGEIDRVSPRIGDVHRVSNAGDVTAVSIHVYGGDIGAIERHVFDADTGAPRNFVSGYSNADTGPLLRAGDAR